MGERAHALLGPSGAEQWTSCPASVLLCADVEDPGTRYSDEGETFHELAEIRARFELIDVDEGACATAVADWLDRHPELSDDQINEMHGYSGEYVELLSEKLAERPGSVLMLEVVVQTGIPECWGTADAVIIAPGFAEVIDIKYGAGVFVSVVGNPQLRLYAVGALMLALLLAAVEVVAYTVWQPRKENHASETMLASDLLAWRDSLLPVAAEALQPGARFGPSEKACRWCAVRGRCEAQTEWATSHDFVAPSLMTPKQTAEALREIPMIKAWAAAVEDAALDDIYSKHIEIPGWKVVKSGGTRKVTDPMVAIELLLAEGFANEQFMKPAGEATLQGITHLEKLLGRARFDDVLGVVVKKGEGNPSLAPESDPRQSVNPDAEAAKEEWDVS
jgi:antitoxin component of MazEF toxin-antitoxin module